MCTSDEDLAGRAAGGDQTAFGQLLERHYDRLFGVSVRLLGDRAEAEDLTQDICLALPKKIGGFRGSARFSTWLYRVAVNAAHDRRRKMQSRTRATEGWGPWEIARRETAREAGEALDWLTASMRRLKPDLRDTAVLILGEELSQADAGEVLGVSEGTVAWRMSEVKKALREMAREEGMV